MKSNSPLFNQGKGKVGNYVVSSRGDTSIVSARVFEKPANSEAQQAQQSVMGGNSSTYKHLLTPAQRQGWIALGQQMRSKSGRPLSGQNAFVSVQTALSALGRASDWNAPLRVPFVANIPPVEVEGQSTPTGQGFQLKLLSTGYSDNTLLLEASMPLSAGLSKISPSALRVVGVLPALNAGTTDVSGLYSARMGRVPNSTQIAVRLTPITDAGFRGTMLTTAGFIALATSAASEDAPEDETEAAPALHVQEG